MNLLNKETSPYLLQHANNPVHWKPWNDLILKKAKEENKLLVISIGYAACHWCHVMEKESFEDEEVASVMNTDFISIKIDREERPDIDQLYMDAVQIMTGSGGWPLNIVALPDGRPVWGGTYFRKNIWIQSLTQISKLYHLNPDQVITYAEQLKSSVQRLHLITTPTNTIQLQEDDLEAAIKEWEPYFDTINGGPTRAPKFMMPVNFNFLLRYSTATENTALYDYVQTSLTKMAYGGIFDHIGGGFSRYAVDKKWHVPHFEKMLYDNAQLVSLYANAYAEAKNELFKTVVCETLSFVERELLTDEGAFYASLDADSLDENNILKEGVFYVWKEHELKQLLKEKFPIFKDYFNINEYGYWEEGNYVLIRKDTDAIIAKKHQITSEALQKVIEQCKKILFSHREKRSQPRLDDKILTSWNALMLKGYVDAYKALGDENYLNIAIKNANFIKNQQLDKDGSLYRKYKAGKPSIKAYLEDYATVADAYISLYEATTDIQWLEISRRMVAYCMNHFFDKKNNMFFFTSDQETSLTVRTLEKNDNVIPASNSLMAHVLFKLARYFENSEYNDIAKQMLFNMLEDIKDYPYSHANWMHLMMNFTYDFYEIVITGVDAKKKLDKINRHYLPQKIIASSIEKKSDPLFKGRWDDKQTQVYICINNSCHLPLNDTKKVIELLQEQTNKKA